MARPRGAVTVANWDFVGLRWYNPIRGRYRAVSASEAQRTNRSVPYPSAHADGSNDWVLVVDLASATTRTGPRG
jgi:hypothetical protein